MKVQDVKLKDKEVTKTTRATYKVHVKDINLLQKAEKDRARNYKKVYDAEKRSLFFK